MWRGMTSAPTTARDLDDALRHDDPHALHRRDPGGELGSSGNADRHRARHVHALAAVPALRPCRPDLAEPRPLRAVGRARVGAPLVAPPPDGRPRRRPRLRDPRRAGCLARRPEDASANSARSAPDIPSTAGRAASRRPPARSARAWRPRSGWRSRASGWAHATTATGFTLFDFDVYAQAGDGCMMEGVASEAASYAAHQRLSNLCWIYDSNRVTIEGHTDLTFTEDVAARFTAYGWNVETRPGRERPRGRRARVPGLPRGGRATDARRRRTATSATGRRSRTRRRRTASRSGPRA